MSGKLILLQYFQNKSAKIHLNIDGKNQGEKKLLDGFIIPIQKFVQGH